MGVTYGYTGIRVTLPSIAGIDSKGDSRIFENVPVILNRVNGRERSVTILSPKGKAVARLTSAITY